MLSWLRRDRRVRTQAQTLYAAVLRVARDPVFYRDRGVPDTFEGRFDLLVLLLHLVLRRLRQLGEPTKGVAQALFDTMMDDMDCVLRESGVSDTAVPKKVRAMAAAFYGRGLAYDDAWASSDPSALEQALARNVLGDAGASARLLAAFVRDAEARLSTLDFDTIASGSAGLFAVGEVAA